MAKRPADAGAASPRHDAVRRLTRDPLFSDADLFASGHGWEWARQTYDAWLHTPLSDAEFRDLLLAVGRDSPLSHFSGVHTPGLDSWSMRALNELARLRAPQPLTAPQRGATE